MEVAQLQEMVALELLIPFQVHLLDKTLVELITWLVVVVGLFLAQVQQELVEVAVAVMDGMHLALVTLQDK
jgi:hypothetical protein